MTPLLILTHGAFGTVLLESAESMYGKQKAAAALALSPDETREDFALRVRRAVAELDSCPLVLVDLACGTPWNVALLEGCAREGEVLAGLSLPLLLEALGLRDTLAPRELAEELARQAPQTFVRASAMLGKDMGVCVSVLLARVDDRLIHGQVVVGWARALEADCLVVANDAVAADPMQRTLLPMAVPPHMKVAILRLGEAAEAVARNLLPGQRAILLFASLPDALQFQRSGGPLKELNIGGIRLAPGRQVIRTAVALGPEDVAAARALASNGTVMNLRMVPGEAPEPLLPLLPSVPQASAPAQGRKVPCFRSATSLC